MSHLQDIKVLLFPLKVLSILYETLYSKQDYSIYDVIFETLSTNMIYDLELLQNAIKMVFSSDCISEILS